MLICLTIYFADVNSLWVDNCITDIKKGTNKKANRLYVLKSVRICIFIRTNVFVRSVFSTESWRPTATPTHSWLLNNISNHRERRVLYIKKMLQWQHFSKNSQKPGTIFGPGSKGPKYPMYTQIRPRPVLQKAISIYIHHMRN